MPIKTRIETSKVGGNTSVTATMIDTPGAGDDGNFTGQVVFVCDGNVTWEKANPKPLRSDVLQGVIELWWELPFVKEVPQALEVELSPNDDTTGPTHYAWTVVSTGVPSDDKKRFDATIGELNLAPAESSVS